MAPLGKIAAHRRRESDMVSDALQFDNIRGLNETAWAAELRMLDGIDPSFRD